MGNQKKKTSSLQLPLEFAVGTALTILLTLLDKSGKFTSPLVTVLVLLLIASLLVHAVLTALPKTRKASSARIVSVVAVVLGVVGLGFWLLRPVGPIIKPVEDPEYVPPRGPLIRHEGSVPVPSQLLCSETRSEVERIACLCPRPANVVLRALPAPEEDNYATEVVITTPAEPMYRVRVFLRDAISRATLLGVAPHRGSGVSSTSWTTMDDRLTFGATSSAPQNEFRVKVFSSTGVRVLCANREN